MQLQSSKCNCSESKWGFKEDRSYHKKLGVFLEKITGLTDKDYCDDDIFQGFHKYHLVPHDTSNKNPSHFHQKLGH